MAVCLNCQSNLVAGAAACVVCGHPRLNAPPAIPRRSVLFGGVSVLTVFVLTALSSIPVTLILYLSSSHDGTSHCAATPFGAVCGAFGAMFELGVWVVYLIVLAAVTVLAQRLTEPSLIGPGLVVAVGFALPWMVVLSHVVDFFPSI